MSNLLVQKHRTRFSLISLFVVAWHSILKKATVSRFQVDLKQNRLRSTKPVVEVRKIDSTRLGILKSTWIDSLPGLHITEVATLLKTGNGRPTTARAAENVNASQTNNSMRDAWLHACVCWSRRFQPTAVFCFVADHTDQHVYVSVLQSSTCSFYSKSSQLSFGGRQIGLPTAYFGLTYIKYHPQGFWSRNFYTLDTLLSANKQHQSTDLSWQESAQRDYSDIHIYNKYI